MKTRPKWKSSLPPLAVLLVVLAVGTLPWLAVAADSLDGMCAGLSFVLHFRHLAELDETLPRRLCSAYLGSSPLCEEEMLRDTLDLATVPWEAFCLDPDTPWQRFPLRKY